MKKISLQELFSPENYTAPLLTSEEKNTLLKKPSRGFSLKYLLVPLCICIIWWIGFMKLNTIQERTSQPIVSVKSSQKQKIKSSWWTPTWSGIENAYYDMQWNSSDIITEQNINVIWAWAGQQDSSRNVIKSFLVSFISILIAAWILIFCIKKFKKK